MPNHVINELIFRVGPERQAEIRAALCNDEGKVDFQVLVPIPANVWLGNVGSNHEKAFGRLCALDWARENWGTKWNAYSHQETEATEDCIIFRFETAWSPPYTWLVAVFNTLKLSFEHNWLDEGAISGVRGIFDWAQLESDGFGEPWREEKLTTNDPLHRHLHKLHWGVEEFPDEDEPT